MIAKTPSPLLERIEIVRRFDGFYERRLRSAYRATEVCELTPAELQVFRALGAGEGGASGGWLNARLRLDPAYLSRILKKFQAYGFVCTRIGERDRRHREFALTEWGRRVQRSLDDDQRERVRALLDRLPQREQRRLVHAMGVVEEILTRDPLEHFLEDWFARRPRERI